MSELLSYEQMDAILDDLAAKGLETRSLGTVELNALVYPDSDYSKRQRSISGTAKVSAASIELAGLFGTGIEAIELQASPLTSALTVTALGGKNEVSQTLDDFRDLLDRLLPEEALGLEFGGSTASGQRMYNGVWIEDGKVKYQYPNGSVRTLGYTPKAAKKKFRRKSRRKRWTTRDQKEMEWRAHIAAIGAGMNSVAPI